MPEEIVHRFEDKWAICWGLMGGWEQCKCMSGRILKHIEKCGVVTNCTLRMKVCELLPRMSVSLYIDTEEVNVGQKEFEAHPKVDMIICSYEQ